MFHLALLFVIPLLACFGQFGDLGLNSNIALALLSLVAVIAACRERASRGRRNRFSLQRFFAWGVLLYATQLSVIVYCRLTVISGREGFGVPKRAWLSEVVAPSGPVSSAQSPLTHVAGVVESGRRSFGGTLSGKQSDVQTISVVLPCADETTNALNTVERFCKRTPDNVLVQIIVVDDGSSEPMTRLFARDGRRMDLDKRCKLLIVRHELTTGLMAAKLTGGKLAVGDVVAFFDCHCSPKEGWHVEILAQIRENPRRMVVPAITDLDLDTFDEKVDTAVNAKCYLTFDADFKWFDDESDFIPTISGGLVAMGREWFNMTGGFDEEMHGWGGENLDQSLRAWLCGGEITRAKSSRIAHMWRTADPRTRSRSRLRAKPTDNRGRVAAAWFDEFLPVYRGSKLQKNRVSNFNAVKERLGCKPFVYFLYRFRKVYLGGAVIAEIVFHLRDKSTGLCLQRYGSDLVASECQQHSQMQQMQAGNLDPATGRCCSGLRNYGGNDCLDYVDSNGPHWYPCDVAGRNQNQQYRLLDSGQIRRKDGRCIVVSPEAKVAAVACDALLGDRGVFEKTFRFEPKEMKIYRAELQRHNIARDFPGLPDN
eukprot:TRINITY_DN23929_c0_g2_i1.p1 TRINITY_DN23929_c0_g2~~TRINITY_DN23929_c0_g2_i1.p1  ORF type:complete len:596 (-),score=92.59 TRINITY_DN23929_c0_g2_i1:128-1915(-)